MLFAQGFCLVKVATILLIVFAPFYSWIHILHKNIFHVLAKLWVCLVDFIKLRLEPLNFIIAPGIEQALFYIVQAWNGIGELLKVGLDNFNGGLGVYINFARISIIKYTKLRISWGIRLTSKFKKLGEFDYYGCIQ